MAREIPSLPFIRISHNGPSKVAHEARASVRDHVPGSSRQSDESALSCRQGESRVHPERERRAVRKATTSVYSIAFLQYSVEICGASQRTPHLLSSRFGSPKLSL